MMEFRFGRQGVGRAWFEALPLAHYASAGDLCVTLPAVRRERRECRIVLEVLIPRGAYAEYALLGASYSGRERDEIVISVSESGEGDARTYAESLASRLDTVWVGLPHPYAISVLDAAKATAPRALSGELSFDCAAHGMVGSSAQLFANCASAIVELLGQNVTEVERIIDVCSAHVVSRARP